MVIQLRMLSATTHRRHPLIHHQLRPLLLNKTKQNRRFMHYLLLFFRLQVAPSSLCDTRSPSEVF